MIGNAPRLNNLQLLTISNENVTHQINGAIEMLPTCFQSLTHLLLSGITSIGIAELAKGLPSSQRITLYISRSDLTSHETTATLLHAVSLSKMKTLDLASNEWGLDGLEHVRAISDGFKLGNLKITSFSLRKNPFGEIDLLVLLSASFGSSLTYLDISENACSGDLRVKDSLKRLTPRGLKLVC
jgi:hypothetical protein